MTSKLDSVRKSLLHDFDSVVGDGDDDKMSPVKFYYTKAKTTTPTPASIKSNNAFLLCALLVAIAITGKIAQPLIGPADSWTTEIMDKVHGSSHWLQSNHTDLYVPLVIGTLVAIFSMLIIYFDSEVPGLSPPTPFSPRKANQIRYLVEKEKNCNLSYLISISSGILVFFLLYL